MFDRTCDIPKRGPWKFRKRGNTLSTGTVVVLFPQRRHSQSNYTQARYHYISGVHFQKHQLQFKTQAGNSPTSDRFNAAGSIDIGSSTSKLRDFGPFGTQTLSHYMLRFHPFTCCTNIIRNEKTNRHVHRNFRQNCLSRLEFWTRGAKGHLINANNACTRCPFWRLNTQPSTIPVSRFNGHEANKITYWVKDHTYQRSQLYYISSTVLINQVTWHSTSQFAWMVPAASNTIPRQHRTVNLESNIRIHGSILFLVRHCWVLLTNKLRITSMHR